MKNAIRKWQGTVLTLAVLVSGLVFFYGSARAAEDVTGPKLTAFSASPNSINTESETQTILATFTVSYASELDYDDIDCSISSGSTYQYQDGSIIHVSGDDYVCEITLPAGSAKGLWYFDLGFSDFFGNYSEYDAEENGNEILLAVSDAVGTIIENTATIDDNFPPVLMAFSASPTTINTDSEEQTITATFAVIDDHMDNDIFSNPNSGFAVCTFYSKDSDQYFEGPITYLSGNDYSCEVTLPIGASKGLWFFKLEFVDKIKNESHYDAGNEDNNEIMAVIPEASGSVIENFGTIEDSEAPQLISFSASPLSIDTSSHDQIVTAIFSLSDSAGVNSEFTSSNTILNSGYCELYSVIADDRSYAGDVNLSSGDKYNGTYTCKITLPTGAVTGEWVFQLHGTDMLDNGIRYNAGGVDGDEILATVPEASGTVIRNESTQVSVVGINIKTPPTKTTYVEGEKLDLSGLVVTVTKSNSSTQDISFGDFVTNDITTDPENGTTLGLDDGPVEITVNGYSFDQDITVNELPVTITSISIKTPPVETNYDLGDMMKLYGLEITLVKSNGNTQDVLWSDFAENDIAVSPKDGDLLTINDNSITISIDGKTTKQDINLDIPPYTITGISIKTPPTKTTYTDGDVLDLSGLVVTLTKYDGSSQDVNLEGFADYSDYSGSGITTSLQDGVVVHANDTAVAIVYGRYSATQNIAVTVFVPKANTDTFISKWDTTKVDSSMDSSTDSNQIRLPLIICDTFFINGCTGGGVYDFSVDWGDGTSEIVTGAEKEVVHAYATAGIYEVIIKGTIQGFSFNTGYNWGDRLKLIEISQWGPLNLGKNEWGPLHKGSLGAYFKGTSNLSITATDTLDLSGTTNLAHAFDSSGITTVPGMNYWDVSGVIDMGGMFAGAKDFNQQIGNWDVSHVANMSNMFGYGENFDSAYAFNQNLNNWNVSNVTNMSSMFSGARDFNQPIGNWNVSNVSDMSNMFASSTFNQLIGNWDVSSVTDMHYMFSNADFNQPIGDWDVSNVTDMMGMFELYDYYYCWVINTFNQPINNWDVSSVTSMSHMFSGAAFDQPINNWDVSSVTSMNHMFSEGKGPGWYGHASYFNQPIGSWDVSNVTDMSGMFVESPFNQPIGSWDVSNVTDMHSMFLGAKDFNQPIGDWDVSRVENMGSMFGEYIGHGYSFNQQLNNWDVSNVTNMGGMFSNTSFDQPIGDWNVSNVTNMGGMFSGSHFNQPIGGWNVSNVTNMHRMFAKWYDFPGTSFNQPIGKWDVSNVTDMNAMFAGATSFNQPIGDWDVSNVTYMGDPSFYGDMFEGVTLSPENYDDLLIGWSSLPSLHSLHFGGGNSKYDLGLPADARQKLIDGFGWAITDGGTTGNQYVNDAIGSLSIKLRPEKIYYAEGDALDLSGLVVTLTELDGSTRDVEYTDFSNNGIAISRNQGYIFNSPGYERITVTKSFRETDYTDNFSIYVVDSCNDFYLSDNAYDVVSNYYPTNEHLVVITHGWNGYGSDDWIEEMRLNMCNQVSRTDTTIASFDWSDRAGTGGDDSILITDRLAGGNAAYNNAPMAGHFLALKIEKLSQNNPVKYLHLIAHSAGSNAIQTAIDDLSEYAKENPLWIKPYIHLTFLDAYTPKGEDERYGDLHDFNGYAEQYFTEYDLPNTNIRLHNVVNFDVTTIPGINASHEWPYIFYNKSVSDEYMLNMYDGDEHKFKMGFPFSMESNDHIAPDVRNGQKCRVTDVSNPYRRCSDATTFVPAEDNEETPSFSGDGKQVNIGSLFSFAYDGELDLWKASGTLSPIALSNSGVADVDIPNTSVIVMDMDANTSWDGTIMTPKIITDLDSEATLVDSDGNPLPLSNLSETNSLVLSIGSESGTLVFDKGVRIRMVNQAGKQASYSQDGKNFTRIDRKCDADSQAVGNALPEGGECKIDIGADLVIWTKHFTTFATYTQTQDPEVTVGGISIKTPPTKTEYTEGENLDLSGLVATLTKSDDSTQDVAFVDFEANEITTNKANGDALTTSDTAVTITVNGHTANQAITVNTALSNDTTITSEAYTVEIDMISNIPYGTSKADFLVSLTKGQVEQTWDDSQISDSVVNGDILKVTAQDGKTTVTYTITVNAMPVTVISISIANSPTKTTYIVGDTLDLSGLEVTLIKSDTTTQDVALADFADNGITTDIENGTELSLGNTVVTITANGHTVSQTITVIAALNEELNDNTTIISETYTVGADMISNVPFGTTKSDFLLALVKGQIGQTWDDSEITDPVENGDILIVTAEDKLTATTYNVTVNAEIMVDIPVVVDTPTIEPENIPVEKTEIMDTTDPDSVKKLSANYKQSPDRVQLDWKVNDSDIDTVYIYRGTSKSFYANSSSRIAKNDGKDTNFTDRDITLGKKYYYKLITKDKAENEGDAEIVSIVLPVEETQNKSKDEKVASVEKETEAKVDTNINPDTKSDADAEVQPIIDEQQKLQKETKEKQVMKENSTKIKNTEAKEKSIDMPRAQLSGKVGFIKSKWLWIGIVLFGMGSLFFWKKRKMV